MSKLNEILGVEDGQEFEYKSRLAGCIKCKIINGIRYTFDGYCWVGCTDEYILTEMINRPEKIKILPTKPKLTEKQVTAIKGRIIEGWKYVTKDSDGTTVFYMTKPQFDTIHKCFNASGIYSVANFSVYDFLKPCECFYLPDLIKEKEE